MVYQPPREFTPAPRPQPVNRRHAALAARILGDDARKTRAGGYRHAAQTDTVEIDDRTRTFGYDPYGKASLDLGASPADRNWHVGQRDKDAAGPLRENVGLTVRSLDYRRYRDAGSADLARRDF